MAARVLEYLCQRARPLPGPGGEEVPTLSPQDLQEVSRLTGSALRQVEVMALQAGIMPERYLRNLGTLGWEEQVRLLQSTVAVVGCGGLGGHVVEGLARTGLGRLIVVDDDRFVPHNLNRQALGTMATLGGLKAEAARERAALVNPAVEVVAHAARADAENLPALLQGAEVVVDALDSPADRLALQAAAGRLGIPLVHGAIAGLIGQVTTVLPGDDTLTLLYGAEAPAHGAESVLGTPAFTPMAVAACQMAEVVKLLLGRGQVLRRQLLYIDLESGAVERFPLRGGED